MKCFVLECALERYPESRYCKSHHEQWTAFSRQFRAQVDFCQHCGQPDREGHGLVTHHKRYLVGRHFEPELMEALCDPCHAKADELRRALTSLLNVPQCVVDRFFDGAHG